MNPAITESVARREVGFRWPQHVGIGCLFLGIVLLFAAAPPPTEGAGLVAADHELASAAGAEVMARGGNAVDAAVAAALAAGVVQPPSSGLGGGGFAVVVDGPDWDVLDFREVAPAGATRDMYLEDGEVVSGRSRRGALAVAVPGESRGLARLHQDHGRLPAAAVAAPAIRYAQRGFEVGYHLARSLAKTEHSEVLQLFQVDGTVAERGTTVRRPALARTLRRWVATRGEDLHVGPGASAIAAEVRDGGGIVDEADLAAWQPTERTPVVTSFRGYTVVTMPAPSSGGLFLAQMLRVLEGYDLESVEFGSSDYLHLLTEVLKHAFADRAHHVGDMAWSDDPSSRLLSDDRITAIRASIWPGRTFPPDYYAPIIDGPTDAGTQHISVVDRDGMAVALTSTVNTSFGSGVVVEDIGLILNNQMDDFAAAPGVPNAYGLVGGEANAIGPGRKPLSSMSPTVVLDPSGEVVLVVGASGGPRIISSTLQVLLGVLVFDLTPTEAVSADRIHHQWQPDKLFLDPSLAPDVRRALEARGHDIAVRRDGSSVQVIARDPATGLARGASDPRKGGRPVAP